MRVKTIHDTTDLKSGYKRAPRVHLQDCILYLHSSVFQSHRARSRSTLWLRSCMLQSNVISLHVVQQSQCDQPSRRTTIPGRIAIPSERPPQRGRRSPAARPWSRALLRNKGDMGPIVSLQKLPLMQHRNRRHCDYQNIRCLMIHAAEESNALCI